MQIVSAARGANGDDDDDEDDKCSAWNSGADQYFGDRMCVNSATEAALALVLFGDGGSRGTILAMIKVASGVDICICDAIHLTMQLPIDMIRCSHGREHRCFSVSQLTTHPNMTVDGAVSVVAQTLTEIQSSTQTMVPSRRRCVHIQHISSSAILQTVQCLGFSPVHDEQRAGAIWCSCTQNSIREM